MSEQFRILDNNFVFDPVSQLFPTSEDAAFPVSNLLHHFRAKCWRSYGFFRISSTNKYLDFKDVAGGATISAVIPEGEYSVAELETIIAARMVIHGGGGAYTVTHSRTTGKWTFVSSRTQFELRPSTGPNAANGLLATLGFDVGTDYSGATTYTGAKIAIHTEERVVIDIGNPEEFDSLALIFDPENGHKFTPNAVIKVQASSTNYWYGTPPVDVTLSIDDTYDVITKFWTTAQNYRYVCIRIVDPENPSLYVEIPKIILSLATQLAQNPEIGFALKLLDQSDLVKNNYGNVFSDIYPSVHSYRFTYNIMDEAVLQTLYDIQRRLGGVVPLAIALDPTEELFDKDRFFCYGRLKRDSNYGHHFLDAFDTDLVLEEAI